MNFWKMYVNRDPILAMAWVDLALYQRDGEELRP